MDPDFSKFTGIGWGISFNHISKNWDDQMCQDYCQNIKRKYSKLTKAWSDDLYSEWLTRNYLAVKMILSASVMLTSFEYCREKNVRIVQPYLLYYATLSCCRAVIFTMPDHQLIPAKNLPAIATESRWSFSRLRQIMRKLRLKLRPAKPTGAEEPKYTDLYEMTHSKIINIVGEYMERLFPADGINYKAYLENLRSDREMFSYKFPAQGIGRSDMEEQFDTVVDLCSLLAEVAQLNSECLEASFRKHAKGEFEINQDIVEKCFLYESASEVILDREDHYRTGYMIRKMKTPCNLQMMATEGLVEDFFGSWCAGEEEAGVYNPDANWRIIFPFN